MIRRSAAYLQKLARKVASEHTTPLRTAFAVALGALIGTSPFYGFHLALCLLFATLFRLNRVITYLAAHVSVPWTAPFLIVASVQCGHYLLHRTFLPLSLATLSAHELETLATAWLLGSLVVGGALGLLLGTMTYFVMRRYRRAHPLPLDPNLPRFDALAEAYRPLGRFPYHFVRGKLRHDPVFRQLLEREPHEGPVIDVGCGRGQGLLVLGQSGLGLDWDERKIEMARTAAKVLGRDAIRFERADIRTCDYPRGATMLMLDVLHYNPPEVQDAMLRRAARALLPGGTLYVRELDAARGLRAKINMWQERIGCLVRLNRGATLCFRPAQDLVRVLASEGLFVTLFDSARDLPLANVLIAAERQHPTTLSTKEDRTRTQSS